jgi:hypothetical protein
MLEKLLLNMGGLPVQMAENDAKVHLFTTQQPILDQKLAKVQVFPSF